MSLITYASRIRDFGTTSRKVMLVGNAWAHTIFEKGRTAKLCAARSILPTGVLQTTSHPIHGDGKALG